MDKPMKILIVGIIVLVLGIVLGVASFLGTIKDPSEEAEETLVYDVSEYSKTVNLDKGEYDIWYEEEETFIFDFGDPGVVTVTDSGGNLIYESSTSSGSESITVNSKDYKKKGSFEIDSSGSYTITVSSSSTLYITPPISVATSLGLCATGVIIGIIGGILMLVGIILFFTSKKRAAPPVPQYGAPPMPPPPAPPSPAAQQPPPPAQSQYTCNYCHQPLRFMSDYQRWYCDYCRRYA
jgi:flagellar basal body-associated protein FliL